MVFSHELKVHTPLGGSLTDLSKFGCMERTAIVSQGWSSALTDAQLAHREEREKAKRKRKSKAKQK